MARPKKTNLDYFPFDVDFFEDEKIVAIAGEFGIKGEICAVKLLCAIYRNGYFIEWSEMLQMKLISRMPGISLELLNQIVGRLVKWGFLDPNLFSTAKILTSRGIQNRYFEATKRWKHSTLDLPYLMVNVAETPVNVAETPIKEKKRKKKKDKSPLNPPDKPGESDGRLFDVEKPKKKKPATPPIETPSIEEVKIYFLSQRADTRIEDWENEALLFFNTFEAVGWVDASRRKISHWESRANRWIIEKEQKQKQNNTNGTEETTYNDYRRGIDAGHKKQKNWGASL
ncbi:MAG: DUF4373 domain-containing protein [Muribaculaceae bacterium]|nr:DUF4373 domain-containing protein [Muribaculaceae bacterium]